MKQSKIKICLLSIIFLVSIISFPANAVQDNLYISIPLGETKCVQIDLPDDSGSTGAGKYRLTVSTDLSSNYRNYVITLNSGVILHKNICFTPRIVDFSSSEMVDYIITVSSDDYGTSRVYSGKVCVGDTTDEECAARIGGQNGNGQTICTPGEKRCAGSNVEQCSSAGNTWLTVQTCDVGCSTDTNACNTAPATKKQDNTFLYTLVIIIGILVIVLLLVVYIFKNTKKVSRDYYE
ncbi:MAG: hypothetical protein KKG13_02555 [Nanoarchaeota archaeon]|nr:hypothetical protein [Nanoarchaeota archaeon]